MQAGLAGLLLCAGCATSRHGSPAAGSGEKTPGRETAEQADRRPPATLEKRSEAYAHFAAGISNDLRDESQAADAEFLLAVQADPGNEPLLLELAQRFLRRRQTDQAIKLLSTASKRRGASGQVFGWLGLAYSQKGETDQAVAAYRVAVTRAPKSLLACHGLAQALLDQKHPEEALAVLDQAARQPDADAPFLVGLSEFLAANIRGKGWPPEEVKRRALALLERAVKLAPTDPLLLHRMAETYKAVGEVARATDLYRELLEDQQRHNPAMVPILREELVWLYVRGGQREEAMKQLRELARDNPANPRVHFLLGTLAVEDRKFQEGADSLDRAILLDPDLEAAYYELAVARISLGQPDEALSTLKDARSRFKDGFLLEFYTGVANAAARQYAEALKAYTSAELLARANDPSRLDHFFYFQIGATSERLADYASAEKYLRRALELAPDDAETLNYLGYMLADRGIKLEESRDLIARALKLEPENSAFLDSMAWVLYKLGNPGDALEYMRKAIDRSDKPDPTLFDHLGDVCEALGKRAEARAAWQRSLELEPNDAVRRKLGEGRK